MPDVLQRPGQPRHGGLAQEAAPHDGASPAVPRPEQAYQDGPAAKAAHRQHLGEVLTGRQREEPERDELAQQIAASVAPLIAATVDAAVDAALASATEQPGPAPAGGSFDGGARQSVPSRAPVSHDQWLVDVIRQRLADRGADF